MASLNKVQLIGYLGADPEVRTFQNGGRIAHFKLATPETWKAKKDGERKERTQWHFVVLRSDRLISIAEKYLRKGGRVYVEGCLETRSYDVSGMKHFVAEIVVRQFDGKLMMMDGAKKETTEVPPATVADDPGQGEPSGWEPDEA